jgi:polyisoprenoid-binding protein YceI
MTTEQLRLLLESPTPAVLLHVLPEDVFAARRIPGSVNACIYETAFPDHVGGLVADRSAQVVVYGAGGTSEDARVAAETLRGLGFPNVAVYAGGLDEWEAAGLPLEGSGVVPEATQPADGRYVLDTAESVIRWTGRNLFNHHSGTVRFSSGEVVIEQGNLASASFTADLRSIACEDIPDAGMNGYLLKHLAHADFFHTDLHPSAEFRAGEALPIPGATPGRPNHMMKGAFTIRGITRPYDFPVAVAAGEGGRVSAQALVDLDRTEFGSIYGSGKFFRFLGQHVVNDIIHLHVKIHAAPGQPRV